MLKVLFSPSEGKNPGGNLAPKELLCSNSARANILNEYNEIVTRADEDEITQLFGIKKFNDCQPYMQDVFSSPLMSAIERYQGVAYDYLEYSTLDERAKEYLKRNTIIFSNLYGPLLGGDTIANYKVKQGNDIGSIAPDKFYKDRFSYQLDLFLAKDEILDLRAGYYDKFYKSNKEYTTLKFLHNISSLKEFMSLEIENLRVQEIKKMKNKTEIVYNIIE